jgi:Spy/CpxP family protein refolding chaperone
MVRTTFAVPLWFLLVTVPLLAQQPQDPIGENLFPPELLMQYQKEIALSEAQKSAIKSELQKAQMRFTEMQWRLQSEVETMASLIKQARVDEQQVMAQLDKVLSLEREIKKAQLALVIRIKNNLTPQQQSQLIEIKSRLSRK